MIKVTTGHDTYYLIDMDKQIAKRVKGEGRNEMYHDDEWWDFYSVYAYDRKERKRVADNILVGYDMYFNTGYGMYDWRISTNVTSIEEVE
jgi:hypothetical protein